MRKVTFFIGCFLIFVHISSALKCHHCMEGCAPFAAQEKICGANIGPSQNAVCVKQVRTGQEKGEVAIRKCVIVEKGTYAHCPVGYTCNQCSSDMCNTAPSIVSTPFKWFSLLLAFVVPKFLF